MNKLQLSRVDWLSVSFLTLVYGLACVAVAHLYNSFSCATLALGVCWFVASQISITAGYHRLYSHKAYKASALLQAFFLAFGAGSVQGSALRWAANHRLHHIFTDTEKDPHSPIQGGFFWSHMGWFLLKRELPDMKLADLTSNRLLQLQYRQLVPIAILMAFLLPAVVALSWGDFWGGLLTAGSLRLAVQYQCTWAINSLAHYWGSRKFAPMSSARDNFWLAIITAGEGWHNYHHRFPFDYRNGHTWWRWDPTKWLIFACSKIGLAAHLRRAHLGLQ
jgi:stearoyl-CoA desaturase (delta-9 desaturase)